MFNVMRDPNMSPMNLQEHRDDSLLDLASKILTQNDWKDGSAWLACVMVLVPNTSSLGRAGQVVRSH